jgi:hypothetical protein
MKSTVQGFLTDGTPSGSALTGCTVGENALLTELFTELQIGSACRETFDPISSIKGIWLFPGVFTAAMQQLVTVAVGASLRDGTGLLAIPNFNKHLPFPKPWTYYIPQGAPGQTRTLVILRDLRVYYGGPLMSWMNDKYIAHTAKRCIPWSDGETLSVSDVEDISASLLHEHCAASKHEGLVLPRVRNSPLPPRDHEYARRRITGDCYSLIIEKREECILLY